MSSKIISIFDRFRTTRVHANVVYTEYIKDRNHVHMNATRWVTLTTFVKYLGDSGKCKVEETPKGWYLEYIERDPTLIAKQVRARRKTQSNLKFVCSMLNNRKERKKWS